MTNFNQLIQDNTRSVDSYVNATNWAKAFSKKYKEFRRGAQYRSLAECLMVQNIHPQEKLRKGTTWETWVHPVIAISFAEWLSPDFSVYVKQTFARFLNLDVTLADEIVQNQNDYSKLAWLKARLDGKIARHEYTQALQHSGTSKIGFALNTNAIYGSLFGMTAKELKIEYNTANVRDELNMIDLTAVRFAELLAAEKIEKEQAKGNSQTLLCSKIASLAVKGAIDLARM